MITERKQRSFLDPQILARLAALPLMSRRPMLGQVSGRHSSPHRGASVEFAEYRKYVRGDDLRRLDWRAFGRSDRFYVKEFEATPPSFVFGRRYTRDRWTPVAWASANSSTLDVSRPPSVFGSSTRRCCWAGLRSQQDHQQHSSQTKSSSLDDRLRRLGTSQGLRRNSARYDPS